jgi:twitching motility protein PilT
LELAETGHLVFSTLHTNSASNTISRFMGFSPSDIQDSVAERLADAIV